MGAYPAKGVQGWPATSADAVNADGMTNPRYLAQAHRVGISAGKDAH